jgi:hypothetical protein
LIQTYRWEHMEGSVSTAIHLTQVVLLK